MHSWSSPSLGISLLTPRRVSPSVLVLLPVKMHLLWPQTTGKHKTCKKRILFSLCLSSLSQETGKKTNKGEKRRERSLRWLSSSQAYIRVIVRKRLMRLGKRVAGQINRNLIRPTLLPTHNTRARNI